MPSAPLNNPRPRASPYAHFADGETEVQRSGALAQDHPLSGGEVGTRSPQLSQVTTSHMTCPREGRDPLELSGANSVSKPVPPSSCLGDRGCPCPRTLASCVAGGAALVSVWHSAQRYHVFPAPPEARLEVGEASGGEAHTEDQGLRPGPGARNAQPIFLSLRLSSGKWGHETADLRGGRRGLPEMSRRERLARSKCATNGPDGAMTVMKMNTPESHSHPSPSSTAPTRPRPPQSIPPALGDAGCVLTVRRVCHGPPSQACGAMASSPGAGLCPWHPRSAGGRATSTLGTEPALPLALRPWEPPPPPTWHLRPQRGWAGLLRRKEPKSQAAGHRGCPQVSHSHDRGHLLTKRAAGAGGLGAPDTPDTHRRTEAIPVALSTKPATPEPGLAHQPPACSRPALCPPNRRVLSHPRGPTAAVPPPTAPFPPLPVAHSTRPSGPS